ncbi:MAG: transposase [Candidatus Marinimicrobia bacterium]|nr:transposase [Candidatus Neomarinimicrobiota bacterium]
MTRLGRLEIRLPRDREGNFSTELFNRYQRSKKALLLALSESYFEGVSTRKVGKIMEKLCGEQFGRSTVSNICKDLDKVLENLRNRTLEKCYPYLVLDARYENIRESRIVNKKAVMMVLGINEEGYREILSVEIGYSEEGEKLDKGIQ